MGSLSMASGSLGGGGAPLADGRAKPASPQPAYTAKTTGNLLEVQFQGEHDPHPYTIARTRFDVRPTKHIIVPADITELLAQRGLVRRHA